MSEFVDGETQDGQFTTLIRRWIRRQMTDSPLLRRRRRDGSGRNGNGCVPKFQPMRNVWRRLLPVCVMVGWECLHLSLAFDYRQTILFDFSRLEKKYEGFNSSRIVSLAGDCIHRTPRSCSRKSLDTSTLNTHTEWRTFELIF